VLAAGHRRVTGLNASHPGAFTRAIAVVGAGPRGLSVLERLCANQPGLLAESALDIHLIDPWPPGAGRVWRSDQPRDLLMNSFVTEATVFTDDSVACAGPVAPGPGLFDWAKRLAAAGAIDEYRPDEATLAEARRLGPSSYASRAFQGAYLRWAFGQISAAAPAGIRVLLHSATAVALDRGDDGRDVLRLADGAELRVDAVVLAQGHLDARPAGQQAELARRAGGLAYFGPSHPLDLPLDALTAGQPVLFRGFGLHFFDCMSRLSVGRGGRFQRDAEGALRYLPSGDEPILCPGSRRGVPYEARGDAAPAGLPASAPPRVLTDQVVDRLRAARGTVDFRRDVWPLLAREAAIVYYRTLAAAQPEQLAVGPGFLEAQLAAHAWGSPVLDAALAEAVPDPALRLDFAAWSRPLAWRAFADGDELESAIAGHLRADLAEARQAWRSPKKQAAARLRALRAPLRGLLVHGVLTARSFRDDVDGWFTGFSSFVSAGPPPSRIEELLALFDAGLVRFAGPDIRVQVSAGQAFTAWSPAVPGRRLTARTLVEARLPAPDVRTTADPLVRYLIATGQARPYQWGPTATAATGDTVAGDDADGIETGGMAVTEDELCIVDAAGRAQPSRFAFGIPAEPPEWLTAAGARPGGNSKLLLDADAIASAALKYLTNRPGTGSRTESPMGQGTR
jgi:FAD-NAD(P)-binding